MDPLLDFSGKTVLITGAGRGFGKLLAEQVAKRGGNIVLGDVNEEVLQVAESINSNGQYDLASGRAVAMINDVSKEADCKALVDGAIEHFGQLDIAVNNAGISHDLMPFEMIDADIMDRQFAVNVKGVQQGMKYQLAAMRKQHGGSILNVSSMAGLGGAPRISAYSAAKHAVIGLTKSAAVEYGKYNVRVNAVCPFFTLTDMVTQSDIVQNSSLDEAKTQLSHGTPLRRLGEPEEIVTFMLMMISPANTYLSGQAIAVDGGKSA